MKGYDGKSIAYNLLRESRCCCEYGGKLCKKNTPELAEERFNSY